MKKVIHLVLPAVLVSCISPPSTRVMRSPQNADCPLCQALDQPATFQAPSLVEACERGFDAVCIEGGRAKSYTTWIKNYDREMQKHKESSFQNFYKELGYASAAAFSTDLFQSHLVQIPALSEKQALDFFLTSRYDNLWTIALQLANTSSAQGECASISADHYGIDSEEKFQDFLKNQKTKLEIARGTLKKFYQHNVIAFVQDVDRKCKGLQASIDSNENLDPKYLRFFDPYLKQSLCTAPQLIEKIAKESATGRMSDKDVEKYISENIDILFLGSPGSASDLDSEKTKYEQDATVLEQKSAGACYAMSEALNGQILILADQAQEAFNESFSSLKYVSDFIYTVDRQQKAEHFKKLGIQSISNYLVERVNDKKHLKTLTDSISKNVLWWPKVPPPSAFSENRSLGRNPFLSLDALKVSSLDPSFITAIEGYSSDSGAYYTRYSDFTPGKIHLIAGFLKLIDDAPLTTLSVVMHELAHDIDPLKGENSGLKTLALFQPELQCFQSKDSFRMSSPQAGETIADHLATEGIAEILSNPKMQPYLDKIPTGVQDFCLLGLKKEARLVGDPHAGRSERVDGIYFANKRIRKLMGCKSQNSYKSCRYEGEYR